MTKKAHPNRGSTLDEFLDEEGVREAFATIAIEEVIALQLMRTMAKRKLSKSRTAQLTRSSRT